MTEHKVLPECIDRLARIETEITNIKDNHLTSIYKTLTEIKSDIKATQRFMLVEGVGIILTIVGMKIFL